ncbi:hypothetical protein ACRRS0_10565 [Agarivorans sp. QJM3NY_29]|uniref:hypothetical protein n=1 Tax=unclassified Agarivorans TaxID=2636026 RepID=UPI003D7CB1B2
MKKTLVLLILCSALSAQAGELQKAFESFTNNEKNYQKYLGEHPREIIATAKLQPNEEIMRDTAAFPNGLLLGENAYMEKITDNKGCLVVMGTLKDSPDEIADYSVEYLKQGSDWIISDFKLRYYFEGRPRFLKEALCDPEEIADAWFSSLDED